MSASLEDVLAESGRLVYTGKGYSMLPMLRPKRDLLILERPSGRLKRYDVALYKQGEGRYVLHRVLRVREDGYELCGDHQWQRERGVTQEQIVGVLKAFVRDGRETKVTNGWYRLYAHLWCDLFWLRAAGLWSLALAGRIRRKIARKWRESAAT